MNYLDFEEDIKILDQKLQSLKNPYSSKGITAINNPSIIDAEKKLDDVLDRVYSNLSRWQKTKVARHEQRPRSIHYLKRLFPDLINLSGDRLYGEDKSVIAGFSVLDGVSVLVIAQEKGNDTQSRIERNFGMMRPEGYRKAMRLMKLADRMDIPIITFIDTPGAYPGKGAEERGQAEAIAKCVECCLQVKVPIISVVIGEGGSGGAIALATANKVLMLEHSIYSVISPEGCASILWRDPKKAPEAAEAMKISAQDLIEAKMIDEIIKEPRGGAHRNHDQIANNVLEAIKKHLRELLKLNKEELVYLRNNRYLSIGRETLLSKDEFYKTQEIDRPYDSIFNWKILFTNNIRIIQFIFVFVILFVLALVLI
ncbi:MAG: acetyl-CoA carboxylase carboxyltransferase subunit alpha [Pelagibacterales bacterium]|jgi:acetyl-CoA carboxylase carboxyl transferase subunit alpha|nr:acetyl-CoA carboxylase carboxyltransferase subunit alpha [Pelagibacterales bacterium]